MWTFQTILTHPYLQTLQHVASNRTVNSAIVTSDLPALPKLLCQHQERNLTPWTSLERRRNRLVDAVLDEIDWRCAITAREYRNEQYF